MIASSSLANAIGYVTTKSKTRPRTYQKKGTAALREDAVLAAGACEINIGLKK